MVLELSDPGSAPYTERCVRWFWASKAGEVRGLKYSPGTVYSAARCWLSTGVTAGDTKGVKGIWRTGLAGQRSSLSARRRGH